MILKDSLLFSVFITLIVIMSVMAGYLFSYTANEVKVINTINQQLKFLDATLCKADGINAYPVEIMQDGQLNATIEGLPWK